MSDATVQRVMLMIVNVEGEVEIIAQGDMDTDSLTEVTDTFKNNTL